MASDSFFVYWTMANGEVRRVSLDGGKVETLAASPPPASSIAVDATTIYWAGGDGAIRRVAKTGGDVTVMAQASGKVDLAVDDAAVYFTSGSTIQSIPKFADVNATPAMIATGQSQPHGLFVTGSLIWAATQGATSPAATAAQGVYEAPIRGGNPVALVSDITPSVLFVAASRLTWTDSAAGAVHTASLDGTDIRDLAVADSNETLDTVVSDETNAYFTTSNGYLRAVSLAGGGQAQAVMSGPPAPARLAIDATNVYFANSADGAIFALSKSDLFSNDNALPPDQPAPAQ